MNEGRNVGKKDTKHKRIERRDRRNDRGRNI